MSTAFGANVLPSEPSAWILTNAAISSAGLYLAAGGSASITFNSLNNTNILPSELKIEAMASNYGSAQTDARYKPSIFICVRIIFEDNNAFDARLPVTDIDNGFRAILHPTISNYEVGVSAYNSLVFSVYSAVDTIISPLTLRKSLSDVLLEDKNYYGIQISTENGLKISREDGIAEAIFNGDTFSMRSKDDQGNMTDAIYFDALERKYKLSGNVIVEGTMASDAVFTDSLYAEQGDVSELTVDALATSRRVTKYLAHDLSDDNYVSVHEMQIQFITAHVKYNTTSTVPLTETLVNRYGEQVSWSKDIASATIQNGIPYIDGVRVYTTTATTGFPVTVYQYETAVKRSTEFVLDTTLGEYIPMDIFGAGDGAGKNQGAIVKTTAGMNVEFTAAGSKKCGLYMNNDGFADVTARRAAVRVNTSAKTITIYPEGTSVEPFVISYTESSANGEDALALTWPDGKTFRVVKT